MKKALAISVLLVALAVYVYFAKVLPAHTPDPALRGSGTVEATEIVVSSKIAARIVKLNVEEGEAVKAGQELVVLNCDEIEKRVAQAAAQLTQAMAARAQAVAAVSQAKASRLPLQAQRQQAARDADRATRLSESASIPQNQLEKAQTGLDVLKAQETVAAQAEGVTRRGASVAEAQIAVARAALETAQTLLVECRLSAPQDGRVRARHYEAGELVLPGANVLAITDPQSVYTWIYIPNAEIGQVRIGQAVSLRADTYGERVFKGSVTRINEKAEFTPKSIQTKEDRTRLVFGVKVALENADGALLPGMPVEAEILRGTK